MTKDVSRRDMRVQREIEADAKLRKQAEQSVNWPDPKARNRSTKRHELKPIHVWAGSIAQKIAQSRTDSTPTIESEDAA